MGTRTRGTAEHDEAVGQEVLSAMASVEKSSCSLWKPYHVHNKGFGFWQGFQRSSSSRWSPSTYPGSLFCGTKEGRKITQRIRDEE